MEHFLKDNTEDKLNHMNKFLESQNNQEDVDCTSGVCVIKKDKSLLERINKKIILEDGRQLLY